MKRVANSVEKRLKRVAKVLTTTIAKGCNQLTTLANNQIVINFV
ncbi:hypothetical protein FEDK69T_09820 [Flavobacterium enshiense DK69]|nr:hypothetical protein FEDK69T_09820 [Flavobacterium enshiense DK69]